MDQYSVSIDWRPFTLNNERNMSRFQRAETVAEWRKAFKIKDSVKGVVVTSVDPGSAAAERGLRPGDVIEEVNHQAVEHPGDVAKAIGSAKSDSKKPALLLVSNGEGVVRFVAVPVN